jgi:hypothetical protein
MADFDIPVEDFEVLQKMVDAGDLSAAAARFRELTKVSAKDAEFFVREMAEGAGDPETADERQDDQSEVTDFDIPVEEFEELQKLVDGGNLSAAEVRFQELTKVPAKTARLFVREMAVGEGIAEAGERGKQPKDSSKGASEGEPEPVYTTIPLSTSPGKTAADSQSEPKGNSAGGAAKNPSSSGAASKAEVVYSSIDLPTGRDKSQATDESVEPSAVAPKKPPVADEGLVRNQLEKAAAVRKAREEKAASDAGTRHWYERILPFFGIPMLGGGLIGVLFCGLGFLLAYLVLQSSWASRAVRVSCAVLGVLGSYGGFVATVILVTGSFSLFGARKKAIERGPIEPSSTVDWISPASSVVEGTDAELQKIIDLYYRPVDALPPVSTLIEGETLTVMSKDVKITGPLTGLPLLDNERDLVADLGRGNSVTLLGYALRLPSDEPGSPLEYIGAGDSGPEADEAFPDIPVSKHRKRPVLRCRLRLKRVVEDDVIFHLFDERTGRKVSSAKMTQSGVVDFRLGVWHRSPLLMVVEAETWASSPAARHALPLGKDVALGLGRAQVAYIGRGYLEGVEDGATIECGKPYRLSNTGKKEDGGMVIVRYAPPYLADSTSLLLTAIRDHLASPIAAFGDFELKPVGPDRNLLGFRVFHVPPMIDNQFQGEGLKAGKARAKPPKVERRVDFATDLLRASFESQRGRGLIAMDEVPGLKTDPENGNLFDLEVPLMVFEEGDSIRLLLEFAADAVEFDLEELDEELELPDFQESIDRTNLTPKQALLDFEQLSRIRVVVDSERKSIRLQP